MVCLCCRGPGRGLCTACLLFVDPVRGLRTSGGLPVEAWAAHSGTGQVLVRRLKYEGVPAVAAMVAPALAELLPRQARCLVPVSRTFTRRVRYGIDAADELAVALSRCTGLPVVRALRAPLWGRPNAGSSKVARTPPRFTLRCRVESAVLVDDVMTTGATLDHAASILGGALIAVTITAVP
jgi:predicted amidophosphoribosyltransferase